MKKLISLLVIFSIIFSMGMITVNADALGNYFVMDGATINSTTNLPYSWLAGGCTRTGSIENLFSNTDQALKITNVTVNQDTVHNTGNNNINMTDNNRKLHFTAMISSQELNFTKIGIKFNQAKIKTNTTSLDNKTLENSDLVMFEKQSDGTVDLTSFGKTIQEDFPFEINKLYKLDCVVMGTTNKMNVYVDHKLISEVNYLDVIQKVDDNALYIEQFKTLLLLTKTTKETDSFIVDNIGYVMYYNTNYTAPAFTEPTASVLSVADDDNYIAENKSIVLSTDASITVDTLLENISGINPSSQLVVIGSDGLYKTGTENVAKGDKVVEVIPVSATTDNKGKNVITNEKITITHFNVDSYNPTYLGTKNTIDNSTLSEQVLTNPSNTEMKFWNVTSGKYKHSFAIEDGKFGKNSDDKILKVSIADDANKDSMLLFWNTNVNADGEYIYVTAELAAENTDFDSLGLATRIYSGSTNKGAFEVFGFGKDENDNVILTSFGDKISGTDSFVFKTNQFYKIDLLFECGTTKVKIYLNGEYLGEKDYAVNVFGESAEGATVSKYEHFFITCGYSEESYWYCDNLYAVKYKTGKPALGKRTAEATLSDDYTANYNNGAVYLDSHGATVEEVLGNFNTTKTLAVFDRDYNVLESTDCITNGAKIVETAKDGETLHYTEIRMPYDCITLTQTSKEEDGVTTYMVNASSLFANSGEKSEYMLLLAQYGDNSLENAELVHIDLTEGYGEEFIKEVNLTSTTDPAGKIKAFIWGEDGLEPLEIKVQ